MTAALPPHTSNVNAWIRTAANSVNLLIGRGLNNDSQIATIQSNITALQSPTTTILTPSTAPTSPVEGQVYYDSGLHKLRVWTGSAWQSAW